MEPLVALYARVSTERQAETQTMEQQSAALQAYAAQRGWTIQPEQIYRHEGHSGARLDRPALDRLRDAVARGTGMAYGNQKQTVPARRGHPLIGRSPKGAGGESCRLRPQDEWRGVPVPASVSANLCAHARAPGAESTVGDPQHARGVAAAVSGQLPPVWARASGLQQWPLGLLSMQGPEHPAHVGPSRGVSRAARGNGAA
jgi:hypothetical protein